MTEWIKCSERLPPTASYLDCKRYLIYEDFEQFAMWYKDKWISDPDDCLPHVYNPTHWQPLPEPPND